MDKKDNSGALFKNNKKTTDNHPDETGTIMVDGKEYWVCSWDKVAKSGVVYRSLSIKSKEEAFKEAKKVVTKIGQETVGFADPFDGDIPF